MLTATSKSNCATLNLPQASVICLIKIEWTHCHLINLVDRAVHRTNNTQYNDNTHSTARHHLFRFLFILIANRIIKLFLLPIYSMGKMRWSDVFFTVHRCVYRNGDFYLFIILLSLGENTAIFVATICIVSRDLFWSRVIFFLIVICMRRQLDAFFVYYIYAER